MSGKPVAGAGQGGARLEDVQKVYDWFTEGFDTPMLVEAKALTEDLMP